MGDGGVAWAGPGLAVIPQTNFLSEIHSRQIDEMSGAHLSNDAFFERLAELFGEGRKKDHGSIFLIQKRMTFSEATEARPESTAPDVPRDLHPSKPLPIIIRATNGKSREHKADKIKLSTVVEPDALELFFVRYVEVCKSAMSGLKKRDRSKGKKKTKAKKKKGGVA